MKIIPSLLVLAIAMLGSVGLQARSIVTQSHVQADLIEINLDQRLNLQRVDSGTLEMNSSLIDKKGNNITLILNTPFYCPEGHFCAQVMPDPHVIQLPLKDSKQDSCGNMIYTAELDERPFDGNYQELVVIDHRRSNCEIAYPAMTEVTYTVITPGFFTPVIKAVSTMTAEALK